MQISNSYLGLGEDFYQKNLPSPVSSPALFLWNSQLAEELQLTSELLDDEQKLAQIFSGNQQLPGTEPMALAYAGHQFGHFAAQLGDGRAHFLGDTVSLDGQRKDIQLKGSGPTQFSRGGDGRCAFGPALREFIMSEAMHALGVPTSRCLAVVTTGETVYREELHPGAVVTRVASSHLRVGTFQFFAARGNHEAVKKLADFAIARHFPSLDKDTKDSDKAERYTELLKRVIDRQIELIIQWMRVGFIHGVMNTDNTAISGETIDYGPCAMLGSYDPQTVYSSIDRQSRYAFGNQPPIAQWNLTRFAECLLPLINTDTDKAIAVVGPIIEGIADKFQIAYATMMSKKLGLDLIVNPNLREQGGELIRELLDIMQTKKMDYTTTFSYLTDSLCRDLTEYAVSPATPDSAIATKFGQHLEHWYPQWQQCLTQQSGELESAQSLMQQSNPVVIPRNHHVESVLETCEIAISEGNLDTAPVEEFLAVLRSPYAYKTDESQPDTAQYQKYQALPADDDRYYQTFCGT